MPACPTVGSAGRAMRILDLGFRFPGCSSYPLSVSAQSRTRRNRARERDRGMSLVDYASSSEDDEADVREGEEEEGGRASEAKELERKEEESSPSAANSYYQMSVSPSRQLLNSTTHLPAPSIEKLPDASLLLSSPALPSHQKSDTDHYSRVAAAMAESESRKREINGSASSYPRSKLPRGKLPHSRNVPDTVGGLLTPPQLSGRSNVVTEDISKLFAKDIRHT